MQQKIGACIVNAPWWLHSAGIHVAILLATTLICVERQAVDDERLTATAEGFVYLPAK